MTKADQTLATVEKKFESTIEDDPILNLKGNEWLRSKKRILKNLIVIGFAWIFLFTAFQSMANLQSSLNSDEGLGTASLSAIYVSLVISSLFVPPAFIKLCGLKWTIVISQCAYAIFMAANLYPKWYTMIPAAILLGISAAPLWTSKCAYLTETGSFYSKLSGETSEAVVNRFFGIFFAMFQSSQIWGNIISSTVLKPEATNITSPVSLCGAKDCPGLLTIQTKRPLLSTVYTLCGIYIGIALISILIVLIFLDRYKRNIKSKEHEKTISLRLLATTIAHLKNKYQLLIIPLTLWSGFEQAFISADFTKSYVTCTKGPNYVGLVMIAYGICDVLGSYGFGFIVKYIGRIPCFLLAAAMNYTVIFVFLFWMPNAESIYVLFILAALWGLSDAVWQTQINALYGVLFKNNAEAAFSNYRLWESIGFAVAYAYSNALCVSVKIYLLIAYLTIGMSCYIIIEIMEIIRLKRNAENNEDATKPNVARF